MEKVKLGEALEKIVINYHFAMSRDFIRKPVAWALYRTWKWADANEKEREDG